LPEKRISNGKNPSIANTSEDQARSGGSKAAAIDEGAVGEVSRDQISTGRVGHDHRVVRHFCASRSCNKSSIELKSQGFVELK